MNEKKIKLVEEVIVKKGTRRCSGRIRDGKFLYYMPEALSKKQAEEIILEIRQSLLNRLQQAYQSYDYFVQNRSTITQPQQLARMAEQIYRRKYAAMIYPLNMQFRRQKTVMGTYRRNKSGEVTIYINDYFKNGPLFLLEYIIAHELSHHHFAGHDKNFYRELAQLCPDQQIKHKLASQYLILKEAQIL